MFANCNPQIIFESDLFDHNPGIWKFTISYTEVNVKVTADFRNDQNFSPAIAPKG